MSMREELEMIINEAETAGLPVSARTLVERARDTTLYPALNKHLWQVDEADLAAEARLQRAHRLLITLHITIPETGESTRMLVHTRGTPGYQPIESLARIPDLALAKVQQLTEDIGRARARLRAFRAYLPEELFDSLDEPLATAEARAQSALDLQPVV